MLISDHLTSNSAEKQIGLDAMGVRIYGCANWKEYQLRLLWKNDDEEFDGEERIPEPVPLFESNSKKAFIYIAAPGHEGYVGDGC
ncbi:hypothetical protein ACKU07_23410 [Enterobacter hormaechei]